MGIAKIYYGLRFGFWHFGKTAEWWWLTMSLPYGRKNCDISKRLWERLNTSK